MAQFAFVLAVRRPCVGIRHKIIIFDSVSYWENGENREVYVL